MNFSYEQYKNAYPQLPHCQNPCASNGYGWHGNGYGWQLDPLKWAGGTTESEEVIEEPALTAQKVDGSMAWVTLKIALIFSWSGINDIKVAYSRGSESTLNFRSPVSVKYVQQVMDAGRKKNG